MKVLLYTAEWNLTASNLHSHIKTKLPHLVLVLMATMKQLIQYLRMERNRESLAILLINCESELDELESVQLLFDHLPILLCLPNEQDHLLRKGYRMQPRLLTVGEEGAAELAAVVEKFFYSPAIQSRTVLSF